MLTTSIKHNIKSFECGPDNKIRINNLFLLFQEAAHQSANKLGFGFEDLRENNLVWVLSNIKLRFFHFPGWMEEIEVSTCPCGFNRIWAFRDYFVKMQDGTICVKAASEWLAIDVNSRKPVNISDLRQPLPKAEERALDEQLIRINPKRLIGGEKIWEVKVPYSSIDENGHVNNSEYVKWSLDALRIAKMPIDNFDTFQISYISEAFENNICEIYFINDDKQIYLFGKNSETGEFIFAAQIKYKNTEIK